MNKQKRESFYKLIQAGSRFESRKRKSTQNKISEKILAYYFFGFMVFPFCIALICILIKKYIYDSDAVKWMGLISLSVSYLFSLIQPLLMMYASFNSLKEIIKEPFAVILSNANRTTTARRLGKPAHPNVSDSLMAH